MAEARRDPSAGPEIGDPGPITREIQSAYLDTVRGKREQWSHWLDYATAPDAPALS